MIIEAAVMEIIVLNILKTLQIRNTDMMKLSHKQFANSSAVSHIIFKAIFKKISKDQ